MGGSLKRSLGMAYYDQLEKFSIDNE